MKQPGILNKTWKLFPFQYQSFQGIPQTASEIPLDFKTGYLCVTKKLIYIIETEDTSHN